MSGDPGCYFSTNNTDKNSFVLQWDMKYVTCSKQWERKEDAKQLFKCIRRERDENQDDQRKENGTAKEDSMTERWI